MAESEEVEYVPWEALAPSPPAGPGRKVGYVVAAALGAAALAVMVTRAVWVPRPEPPPPSTGPVLPTTLPTAPAPAPSLYTEADLMAVLPAATQLAAVARAEWFVTDYFTRDRSPGWLDELRRSLPPGVLPDQEAGDGSVASYVEWARALETEAGTDGTQRVVVAFRVLTVDGEGLHRRLPVRLVAVSVDATAPAPSVLDLPEPVVADPVRPPAVSLGTLVDDPPPGLVDQALTAAAAFGRSPAITSVYEVEGGWRVVVTATDEAGLVWPLALRLESEVTPAP